VDAVYSIQSAKANYILYNSNFGGDAGFVQHDHSEALARDLYMFFRDGASE
jgi:hypothetical protein